MTNSDRSRKIVKIVFCVDLFQSPAVLLDGELALVNSNFSDRVVPSILEPFQGSVDQRGGLRTFMKNATENTAQEKFP